MVSGILSIQAENGEKMKVVAYRIQSGWDSTPIWWCKVEFDPNLTEVAHLHTNAYLGAPLSVFKGKVSGLKFYTHSAFPIESREGYLCVADSQLSLDSMSMGQKAQLNWTKISVEEAVAILQEK